MSEVVHHPASGLWEEDIGLRLLHGAIADPPPVLMDLVQRGFEQKLAELYESSQPGECRLG